MGGDLQAPGTKGAELRSNSTSDDQAYGHRAIRIARRPRGGQHPPVWDVRRLTSAIYYDLHLTGQRWNWLMTERSTVNRGQTPKDTALLMFQAREIARLPEP